MPNRRMVSKRITKSSRFLTMPNDVQLLYFHMIVDADDDGIVETYPLMRMLGVPTDNIKVLIAKDFIRQINDDQVMIITDWIEHNLIRADRKTDSIYLETAKKLYPDIEFVVPKERSDLKKLVDGPRTGKGQPKRGKVKLSKEKRDSLFKKLKPYFRGEEMRWSQNKWWVLPRDKSSWLEFAGKESDIEWRE